MNSNYEWTLPNMFLFFFANFLVARKVVWATVPQQESIETPRKNSIATEAKTTVAEPVGVAGAAEAMARYELITCFYESFRIYEFFFTIFKINL